MKIKTSKLTGAALDWAVAKCEGVPVDDVEQLVQGGWIKFDEFDSPSWAGHEYSKYSTDWAQGGPIIDSMKFERICVNVSRGSTVSKKFVELQENDEFSIRWVHASGPTTLIAAMRCYVASKLGDEVNIPKELL